MLTTEACVTTAQHVFIGIGINFGIVQIDRSTVMVVLLWGRRVLMIIAISQDDTLITIGPIGSGTPGSTGCDARVVVVVAILGGTEGSHSGGSSSTSCASHIFGSGGRRSIRMACRNDGGTALVVVVLVFTQRRVPLKESSSAAGAVVTGTGTTAGRGLGCLTASFFLVFAAKEA